MEAGPIFGGLLAADGFGGFDNIGRHFMVFDVDPVLGVTRTRRVDVDSDFTDYDEDDDEYDEEVPH